MCVGRRFLKKNFWAVVFLIAWMAGMSAGELGVQRSRGVGPVPCKAMGFVSLESFSQGKRYVVDGVTVGTLLDDLPLWHSTFSP